MSRERIKELAIDEILKRYVKLSPEMVLNESKGYAKEIEDAQAELHSVVELKAASNSEVHSGNISKPVEDLASVEMELQDKLEMLIEMSNIVAKALDTLSDERKRIIEIFFFDGGNIGQAIDQFSHEHGYSVRGVYRERRAALEEFAEAVEAEMTIF